MSSGVALALAGLLLWLYVPGLLIMMAAGIKHRFLVGYAPAYSFTLFAILSVIFPLIHVRWVAKSVIGGVAVAAALVLLFRIINKREIPRYKIQRADVQFWFISFAAVLVALLPICNVMRRNLGFLTEINNSFDSMFHYNAVQYIRSTGDSWPTHLFSQLTGKSLGFYPILFHLIASLQSSDVILATNIVAYSLPVVFVTSLASLMWTVVKDRKWGAVAILLVLPSAFIFYSLPATVWAYGLWPNALGLSVLPIGLATIYLLYRRSVTCALADSFKWKVFGWSIVEPLFVMVGVVAAHTSGLFAYFWMIWAALVALAVVLRTKRRKLSRWLFVVASLAFVFYVVFVVVVMREMALTNKAHVGFLGAFSAVLFDKLRIGAVVVMYGFYLPLFAAFIIGLIWIIRTRLESQIYWLVFLVSSLILALSSVVSVPFFSALSNPWYQGRERVVPLFTMAVLVVALMGTEWLLASLSEIYRKKLRLRSGRYLSGKLGVAAVVVLLAAMLITPTAISGGKTRLNLLYKLSTREVYRFGEYISPREKQFIVQVARKIPKNSFILGLPADGVSYFYALTGKHVLFYSSTNPSTQLQRDLAENGDDALQDPIVRRELCRMGYPIYLYVDRSAQTGINVIGSRQLPVFYSVWKMSFNPGQLVYSSPAGEFRLYRVDVSCK